MRVLFWGTFDLGKPRTRILIAGLRQVGVEVVECHRDVWSGVEDKASLRGAGRWWRRLGRWLAAYPALVIAFLRQPRPDVVLVGYLGLLDVLILWPFARARRLPLVWDVFVPLHDTVVGDRRLLGRRHPLALLLRGCEWLGAHAVDLALLDTGAQAAAFRAAYGLATGRVASLWVGAEAPFFAVAAEPPSPRPPGRRAQVLFYGQMIPLHGVETIVAAAKLLRAAPIDWLLVGDGQEGPRLDALLAAADLPAVRRRVWIPYAELPALLAASDVCLGVFGAGDKAARVIPNKVFQALAAGRPLVTRDGPGSRELLQPGPGLALVPPADPRALAEAIVGLLAAPALPRWLHAELAGRIAPAAIGERLRGLLARLLAAPVVGAPR